MPGMDGYETMEAIRRVRARRAADHRGHRQGRRRGARALPRRRRLGLHPQARRHRGTAGRAARVVPRHTADAGSPGRESRSSASARAAILVVDDNADKRMSIASVLEGARAHDRRGGLGRGALRAVMKRTFAVILMDVQMPGMDGYETARLIRLREECEHTPIIFITAHTRTRRDPVAYASGAVDFIFAPIVPVILRAKVAVFVELFLNRARARNAPLAQFRDSEAQTRSVLDNVADGIVTLSDEGDPVVQSRGHRDVRVQRAGGGRRAVRDDRRAEAAGRLRHPRRGQAAGFQTPGGRSPRPWAGARTARPSPWNSSMSDVALGHRNDPHRLPARHLRASVLHRGPAAPGAARQPHRPAQPGPVQGPCRFAVRAAVRSGSRWRCWSWTWTSSSTSTTRSVTSTATCCSSSSPSGWSAACAAETRWPGSAATSSGSCRAGHRSGRGGDVVWKIQQALEPTFHVNGHAIEVRASIGVALAPGHGDNIDDLLRRADLAMYDAKRTGSGFAVFAAEQEETPARRLALLGDLPLHRAQRTGAALPAQDRPRRPARRSASRP